MSIQTRETVRRCPRVSMETWQAYTRQAERAARRAIMDYPSLTPDVLARVVAESVPRDVGVWLLARLAMLGWSRADARLPFDVLERETCPADLRGPARGVVALALFGPAGQGKPAEAKERQRLFQQVTSEIVREARDLKSLELAATRALRSADVHRDGTLLSMVQGFLAERRSQLAALEPSRPSSDSLAPSPFSSHDSALPASREHPNVAELKTTFERIRHELDDRLVHFDLPGAHLTLGRMDGLQKRFADVLPEAAVERARADIARVEQRRQELFAEIDALTVWATAAAREGKHDEAAQAVRRLSTLHASRPLLLSDARFNEIRERIIRASHVHEHRVAAEALLARERAVIAELRGLADSIRRFQELSRREAPDSPGYLQVKADYVAAVEAVKSHDTEWLAALTLELDELMSDLHDPTHRADQQVNRFLDTVREALARLRQRVQHAPST